VGDSVEDDAATKPSERKKNRTSIILGSKTRHPTVVIPSAASPPALLSELTLDAPTALEADDMHGARHASDVRSDMVEVKDSQSPRHGVLSQNIEQQSQPAPFAAEKLGRDFDQFYYMIQRATDQVIASIGTIGESLSFLDETPSKRLESLYASCLGSDWQAVRVRLTQEYVFTAPEVTMSVISAFLFDNVLDQQASIQDIQAKLLELKGTTGRANSRAHNLESGGEYRSRQVERIHD
jgi:hypothetical protein